MFHQPQRRFTDRIDVFRLAEGINRDRYALKLDALVHAAYNASSPQLFYESINA